MPDPYQAKGWPRSTPGEVRTELEQFTARLSDLGATPDELNAVADSWDDLAADTDTDPDAWTRERRAALVRTIDDSTLLAMIAAARDEYEHGTTTEADAEQKEADRALLRATAEAVDRMGGNVESILAWVADDPVRAAAVYDLERTPDGAGRTTLLAPLLLLIPEFAGRGPAS